MWTYSPTVGYTRLFQKGSLEWSTTAAVDFYSENDDTDYQNGAVFRLDSVLVKRFANGWGIGAAGGWIEQLEDDDGALADRLDGFKGHSLALGPMATYLRKWDGARSNSRHAGSRSSTSKTAWRANRSCSRRPSRFDPACSPL